MTQQDKDAEKIVYTSCGQNGCWGRCIVRVHVKSGAIAAIEPDDTINPNDPREDLEEKAYRQGMVQVRACVRGRAWRRVVHHPKRLLNPMKRVGMRGSDQWERITWEEALDTIAEKIKDAIAKYGPYSVSGLIPGIGGRSLNPLAPWTGFGFAAWGNASWSGHELAQLVTTGFDWRSGPMMQKEFDGNEAPDFLNCRAIIMWGWNPAVNHIEISYYLMLAKERGIPIIVIDPAYTLSAEAYGSQWIPIRPGTDAAALLAVAHVLFFEQIYDRSFVSRFVEPEGFEEFRRYVMGESDSTPKTPEWAEKICGVPADTLRELARLVAKERPVFFKLHWSVARKLYGETTARLGMIIPAMTGNLGQPGTCSSGIAIGFPRHSLPLPEVNWHVSTPNYDPPVLMHCRKLADAILLREDLEAGRLCEDEYRRRIGAPPDGPLADPRVVWFGRDGDAAGKMNGLIDINKQMRALEKVDFTFSLSPNQEHHANLMADLILPLAEPAFETTRGYVPYLQDDLSNYFICAFKSFDPPGEARPSHWIWLEIARRFGKAEAFNGRLANVPYECWDGVFDDALREAYETWGDRQDIRAILPELPSWDEFKQRPVIRVPLKEAYYPFREQISGKRPFGTPSGKVEFVPQNLRDPEFPRKDLGDRWFGGSVPTEVPAVPEWRMPPDSPMSAKAKPYPLQLLTPHSIFRQHSAQDNNPWLRDEYRHAAWLSIADAKVRSVKDGDLVRVYSDKGEVVLPACVTSRLVPGVAIVRFGAWYTPDVVKSARMPFGIDKRGAANLLTSDDLYPWVVGVLNCSNLVEVEKV